MGTRHLLLLSLCKDLYFTTFDARLYAAEWGEKEILRVKDVVLWNRETSAVMHFLCGSFGNQRTPKPELSSVFPSSSYPSLVLPGSTYWLPLFWTMVAQGSRYIVPENCSLLFFLIIFVLDSFAQYTWGFSAVFNSCSCFQHCWGQTAFCNPVCTVCLTPS